MLCNVCPREAGSYSESPTLGGAFRVRLVIDADTAVLSNVSVISPSSTSAASSR